MPRKRRTAPPAEHFEQRAARLRKRRLSSYPPAFAQTIEVAMAKTSASTTFDDHAKAVAFRMRWYRFRLDAIEDKMHGALELRSVSITGTNGDGTAFDTRRDDISGPYTLTWRYDASLDAIEGLDPVLQETVARSAALGPRQEKPLRPDMVMTSEKKASEDASFWAAYGKGITSQPSPSEPGLDIPVLDITLDRTPLPPCPPHEPDELIPDMCAKCRGPMPK